MTRVWVCDKCGKQFKDKADSKGNFLVWDLVPYESWEPVGHVCHDCFIELNKTINRFFDKKLLPEKKET